MADTTTRAEEYRQRMINARLARESKCPVLKAKRPRVAKATSGKPDPLERVEYAPDNSRIGEQSKGIQTSWMHDTSILAAMWVYEWHVDLEHKMLVPYVPVMPQLPTVPFVVVRDAEEVELTRFDSRTHIDASGYYLDGWIAKEVNRSLPNGIIPEDKRIDYMYQGGVNHGKR